MNQRLTFDRFPPDDLRLPMCDWLRHHCIDPNDVAIPGFIEIQPTERRVVYEAYMVDEHGKLWLDPATDDAAREVRVVQLEAAPAPFPDVVYARFTQ